MQISTDDRAGKTVRPDGDGVVFSSLNGSTRFSWRWLRDHGEDEASRDPDTLQRRVDTFTLDPAEAGAVTVGEGTLTVRWPNGETSVVAIDTLEAVAADHLSSDWSTTLASAPTIGADVILWSDPASIKPPDVDAAAFLNDDDACGAGVELLCRYGYLVLRGDTTDRSLAEALANRLGYVRQTIFGGIWDLAANLTAHADTAYTQIYLGPHTDGTYSHDAPGLQFFHCVRPADEGGESLLVDGFAIAAELAASDPEVAAILASVVVAGRYVEPGVHLLAERPVLRTNHRGELVQVSFNNYDRAPFLLPPDLEERFYSAYGRFAALSDEPSRRAVISLTAGDFLVFDNWRTLHGRNAFSGPRHYIGGYLNHEDLESKRRVLNSKGSLQRQSSGLHG